MSSWTFFTNYGHVLFLLAQEPDITVREMSIKVGITERAIQRILSDLEKDNFIEVTKVGRQNTYKVNLDRHLRHDLEKNTTIKTESKHNPQHQYMEMAYNADLSLAVLGGFDGSLSLLKPFTQKVVWHHESAFGIKINCFL